KWQRDSVDLTNGLTATFTMDADHTLTAIYAPVTPVIVTRTLTVASVNPSSGVTITVSPPATNGQANGTTLFMRIYTTNSSVMLTAPITQGANSFLKWQRDNADLTTSLTATVTMDADHTLTAVYGGSNDAVGWWQFEDGSGTTALDSSGNGNHGRLTNGPVFV